MKKIFRKEEGFTIIEVVLVLAIAGLIFLVVFLALPQLQKNRRDTQRKSDTGRIAAALESYAGNSNGTYPSKGLTGTITTNFLPTYVVGQNFDDPSTGTQYVLDVAIANAATIGAGVWNYYDNSACGENGAVIAKAGSRNIAIRMGLEQGVYCVDNS